ncbi:Dormancy/auxin associated protein [Dioscorea alata]|uniref:LOW QUALITY PROTEIN: auxin-repressed 12.5 kDa protein-like n=3 Tax=Dioscorea TaxID=4672 RepID=A0AB40CN50_DIOCR|nr:LOW QUALITY PROTEIN: auxin-repressed 12.5 kDa protein-like [Dioscorea cayenensis subsp. rotundata]KAH7661993.1 Dormancy/auxin associated protein [Dioscorea alata]
MVLLDKLWDDVVAGPSPDKGLGKLRKISTKPNPLIIKDGDQGESSGSGKYQRSMSMPETPKTPVTPTTPGSAKRPNVWRSVFNPGSNLATKKLGANLFDKPEPNSPTVYDWLYSSETRSNHR